MVIPTWIFYSSLFASFSVGVGIGYKVQSPTISQDKTKCNKLASFPQSTWVRSLEIGRTYRNGKCVSVSCPYFTQERYSCDLDSTKCKLIS